MRPFILLIYCSIISADPEKLERMAVDLGVEERPKVRKHFL